MCVSAALAAGALYGAYQSKREGDRTKRFADQQEEMAKRQKARESSLMDAKKRARQARLTASGGYGFADTIRTGGTLGTVGPQKSMLGG